MLDTVDYYDQKTGGCRKVVLQKNHIFKILRISYTIHITNEEVLNRMATTRHIINTVQNRQMSFFGHVMRNKEIESIIISGKIEGSVAKEDKELPTQRV